MSWVNNVILTFGVGESDVVSRVEEVNAVIHESGETGQGFLPDVCEERSDWYGGSKCLEHEVFVAAFNYVGLDTVLAGVGAAKWEEPEHVRVFWCGQEDDAFEQVWPRARAGEEEV